MEKQYNKARKLVLSKYGEDYPYYNMMVVALTMLFYKYKDYDFLIEKTFNDTDIYIIYDSIRNILKAKNIDIVSFLEEEDIIDEGINSTYGVSSLGYSFKIENNELVKCKENSFIICSSKCSNDILINTFIHEFNHLIKSSIDNTLSTSLDYCLRSGISYYRCMYNNKKDILYEYEYYDTLDEVINVIETTEMLSNIELLNVDNSFIDSLDKDSLNTDFGYTLCVKLIRPLWDNPTFRNLIEDNILEGNIDRIISSFDEVLGEGSFEKFNDYLEDIDSYEGQAKYKKKTNRLRNNIIKMINEYNSKTYYTYHK